MWQRKRQHYETRALGTSPASDCIHVMNSPIVFAGAATTYFLGLGLKGIGPFLKTLLNCTLSSTSLIGCRVETTNASAYAGVTSFSSLKATAVQLQTTRPNAVASDLAWRQFFRGVGHTRRSKGSGVASQNGPNGDSSGSIGATFVHSILAVQAGASSRVTAATSFEAITVEGNTLGLGTTATAWVLLEGSHLKGRCTEKVQHVEFNRLLWG